MIDPLGIKKNDPLGLKKKVDSKPLSQEELWGSNSQPQDLYTSLVTEPQEDQQASDGLDGPPKMKQFTGLTPEEQKTLQDKPIIKVSKSVELTNKRLKLQNELSKTKVTPENQVEISRKTDELSSIVKEQDKIGKTRLSELEQQFKSSKDENSANAEAEERLNNLITNTGVWNNVKSTSIDFYNNIVDELSALTDEVGIKELKADTDPLSEEKNKVVKDALKKKIRLNDQEIEEAAKNLYKEKQVEFIETDRINSFLDNLDDEDKNLLKQDRYNRSVHLQEDNVKQEKIINAYEVVGNKKIKEYQDIENELLNFKSKNKEIPKDLYDSYINLGFEIKGISNNISKRQKLLQKNKEDLGDVNQEFDFFKRQYGDVENFLLNTGTMARKLAVNTLGGLNYVGSLGGLIGDKNIGVQKDVIRINAEIDDQRDRLRKSVESIESPEGFVNYVSDIMSNQITSLVATSTGAVGLTAIGVSTAGEKYADMNKEVLEGKAIYSPLQMASVPFLYGASEVVSEIPTLSILKKGGRLLESISKNEAELITKSVKQKAKEWAKDWSIDTGKEIAGEEFTNFAQNFTNKYVLGKKDVGLLDNAGTVLKDTFTLTSILKAAPHVAGAILKPHQSNEDLLILDENSRKIIEFTNQIDSNVLSDKEKAVVTKQMNKLVAKNSEIIANTIDKVDNMPVDVYKKVIELNDKAASIKSEAVTINDGVLPNKNDLLKELSTEYKSVKDQRNALVNAEYKNQSPLQEAFNKLDDSKKIKLKDEASRLLIEDARQRGLKEFEFNDKTITEKAVELFKKEETKPVVSTVEEVVPAVEEITPAVEEVKPAEEVKVENNGIEYTKNEDGNWVNNKTGNEVKGIGETGKELIKTLDELSIPKTKAEQYSEELDKTKESDPEAYWSVSPVSAKDAAKGTIIDTPDGAAIVKPDGDIAGLFKKSTSKAKGVAQDLLKRAIAAGGKKLDNYDTYLTPQYIKAGFRVVSRTPFNEKYAPPGWNKEKHGTPDVVAMIYDPEGKLDIEEKTFNDPDTGYDEAIAYRDSLLEIEAELEGLAKLFDESEKGFRVSQVDNAKEALKGILPGVEFIVHETTEAYNNATDGGNSGGMYIYREGVPASRVIHINKQKANGRTVAHEVFHAVILDKIKGDKKVQEITARMVDAVYKTASPELKAKLDAFAAMYSDKSIRDEERLAELIGIIADGYPQMSQINKGIVKRWLDALAKTFGLKPFTDNEVIDLLNTLAGKISTGEVISEEDVAIIDSVDNKESFETEYVHTNGTIVDTPSKRRAQINNTVVKESDIIDPKILVGKPLEIVYYDNFTSSPYKLTNRVSGSVLDKKGEGGPGYSYREDIRKKGIIAAFTNVTKGLNLIQGIRSRNAIAKESAVVGVALQNKETGHLGNKTTELDFYSPTDGVISQAINDNLLTENQAVEMLKGAVDAYESTKKGTDSKSSLNFTSKDFSTLDEFYKKIGAVSFERRGTFNAMAIRSKAGLRITKSTKPYVKTWLESGIPTLNEYYDSSTEQYTKEAEAHDIVKYLDPNLDKVGIDSTVVVTDAEIKRAKAMGVEIKNIDDNLAHTSYPVVLFGKNIGVPSTFHSVRDMSKDWNVLNPFFKAGRRSNIADPVRIPEVKPTGKKPSVTKKLQQAKGIDEMVRIAKEAKYTDAAISAFLKAKGFNIDEITKAILGYDKKTIETRQKEEGIFTREGKNKVLNSLSSFKRKFLSARSFLGRSTFIAKEGIEAGIKAQSKIASYLVSDLDNAIKKYDGDKEKVIADFDKFIRGEKVDLPDNFLEIGNAMRDHIDKLSYELINSGAVDEYQAENIKKNIGSYLTRSYEVFDKKDWAKMVDEESLQAARNYLKKQLLSEATKEAKAKGLDVNVILENKVDQAISDLINREGAQSFVSSGKTGSKDISILKQKTDIPLEIRALMGEYTDPAQNYSRTIFKVASLINNAKFLNDVRYNGIGVYLFEKNDINRPKEFDTLIAAEGSDTMNPLNGLYTTKEMAGSLKESAGMLNAIEVALPYEISGAVRSTYEYYMKLLGGVKWLKTIGSVGTHFKNVSGNITFMLANGYFKPDAYRQSAKVIYNDFLKNTDQELRDKMQEYIEAGIIDQSAVLGELRSMFKDEDFDKTFERRMNSEKLNSTNKLIDRVKRFGSKSSEIAQNAYQAEDDYFKIVSYETEKNRYAKAMFRNDYSKLYEDEQNDVRDHVREITKNVLPNYGRVPGAVKLVKAFPVVGTFISFQTEALRTAYNIVNLSVTELKSSNPEIKKIGALRMSGIIASQAIKYGVMYLIGGSMLGDDDDEKKEKAKRFVAPWSKNSNVLVKDDGDGKFSYIDFSASDPFGGIVKPINAAMRGDDLLDGFIQGTKELVSPFTNPDILKSMFTEISENKDSYGNQLYNPSDTFEVKSSAILSRVYKTFEPGTLTSVRKISKSDSPLNEMTGQFTGYKANDVDLAKQFSFKISDMKKMEVETRNIYNRAFRKFENKEITEAELQAAYNQSNKATIDTYKELKKDYDAAIYFGTDYKDLKDEMKRSKVSKDVIRGITTGDFKNLKKKEGIETDAQLKARNPKVYEKIMRFRARRKNAQ